MSFSERVASLHPIIISGLCLLAVASTAAPMLAPLVYAWLLVWFVWTPCVYVVARNATTPPPQQRYPMFAIAAFTLGIGGWIGGQLLHLVGPLDIAAPPSLARWVTSAAVSIGSLVSFWVTADALIKAETGRSALADPHKVSLAFYCVLFPIVGVWFLQPRIKRVLDAGKTALSKA